MNKYNIRHNFILSFIVFIVFVTVSPLLYAGLDDGPDFREYVSQGNQFKCTIPSGWNEYDPGFGLSQEEKKVYGVTLFGPKDGGRIAPTISIHYYAPGNLLHKTMDKFIRAHSEPVLGTASEGETYGKVSRATIAGREAKTFERMNVRFTGGRSLNPQKVILFEDFIVIPDSNDQGFYVLRLSVPAEAKNKYKEIFGKVAKSFLPQR